MVVDTLENLEKYASLNPLFAQAIEFLKSHDLQAMEIGKTELKGKDLLVNIAQTKPKTKEEAKLETHNEFIDIQIPSVSYTHLLKYREPCRIIIGKIWDTFFSNSCLPVLSPVLPRKRRCRLSVKPRRMREDSIRV